MESEKLWYFAHPYSAKDVGGERRNFELCCIRAAKLLKLGYKLYVPICHTHPMHEAGPQSWEFWLELDKLFVDRCDGIILGPNWAFSRGCNKELNWFKEAGKPVLEYERLVK